MEVNMARKITDKCACCGNCVAYCPVDAIKEDTPIYVIDASTCIDCGVCEENCPSDAIEEE